MLRSESSVPFGEAAADEVLLFLDDVREAGAGMAVSSADSLDCRERLPLATEDGADGPPNAE